MSQQWTHSKTVNMLGAKHDNGSCVFFFFWNTGSTLIDDDYTNGDRTETKSQTTVTFYGVWMELAPSIGKLSKSLLLTLPYRSVALNSVV